MHHADPCDEVVRQLIEGRSADQGELATHVRSCLRCFRVAVDLREVPRVAGMLDEAPRPDPGDLFWAKFPSRVADAWEARAQSRRPAARVKRWLTRPLPAAMAGAVAAVLALAFVRAPQTNAPAAPVAAQGVDVDGEADLAATDDEPLDLAALVELEPVRSVEPPVADDVDATFAGTSAAEQVLLLDGDEVSAIAVAFGDREGL